MAGPSLVAESGLAWVCLNPFRPLHTSALPRGREKGCGGGGELRRQPARTRRWTRASRSGDPGSKVLQPLTSGGSVAYRGEVSMPSVRNLRDYLLIRDAASFLGVSEATLRNWDREGKIATYRNPVNRYRLFRKADLETLLHKVERSGRHRSDRRRAR